MKALSFFVVIAAITATSIACQKADPEETELVPFSVTFGMEKNDLQPSNAPTKTFLDNGTQKFLSAVKSLITFYSNKTTVLSTVLTSAAAESEMASRTFEGTIPKGCTPVLFYYNGTSGKRPTYVSDNVIKCTNDGGYNYISNNQASNYKNNSFQQSKNPLIAKPTDTALRNIMGFFKWKCDYDETSQRGLIKSVKIETLDGQNLTGDFTVDYTGADPIAAGTGTQYDYVISAPRDAKITSGYTSYAIVFPGTYKGVKLTITLQDNTSFSIKDTQTIIVRRGEAVNFGKLPTAPLP